MYQPQYDLSNLTPAPYNPRRIDDESLAVLKDSLDTLGLVKPIIVTDNGLIVAGHQRTKSLRALGITHAPAFVLHGVNEADEMRFNQIHNAADLDEGDGPVRVPASNAFGFVRVDAADIETPDLSGGHAGQKAEILRLLALYGEWGSCVASQSGEVLVSGLYAFCCKSIRRPVLVYYVPDSLVADVRRFFGRQYGTFSYDHLPRQTWVQSLAQMKRLRTPGKATLEKKPRAQEMQSRTYENGVLPRITTETRVLDFGAGQMDYVKRLAKNGYNIRGVEFYYRDGMRIDVAQVHRDIDSLCRDLEAQGRYEAVICDSVMNSVDSVEAEADVLTCLSSLCLPGGMIVFSGRSLEDVEKKATLHKRHTNICREVQFLDENGLTAIYGNGAWRYQKFHSLEQVKALTERHFSNDYTIIDTEGRPVKDKLKGGTWCVVTKNEKPRPLNECAASLSREFDLPLPGGRSYQRGGDILTALAACG